MHKMDHHYRHPEQSMTQATITAPEPPCYAVVETPYTGEQRGRGVVATRDMTRGTVVEEAHCILIPRAQYEEHARHTVLEHYLFRARDGDMLLGLGVASLFNHSISPSLDFRIDREHLLIRFFAARDIKEGEELKFCYGRIWFQDQESLEALQQKTPCMHEHMDDPTSFLAAVEL